MQWQKRKSHRIFPSLAFGENVYIITRRIRNGQQLRDVILYFVRFLIKAGHFEVNPIGNFEVHDRAFVSFQQYSRRFTVCSW